MKYTNLTHSMVRKLVLIISIANVGLPIYAYQDIFYDLNRPPIPRILNPSKATSNPIASAFNIPLASNPIPEMENTTADALPINTDINNKMEATVTVPIQLPTGTANVTPQIALHYNDQRSHIYTGNTASAMCYINGQPTNDSKKQCFAKRTLNSEVKWAQSAAQNSLFESAIKHGHCYRLSKSRSFWSGQNEVWIRVTFANRINDNLKQCYDKHKYRQKKPARFSWWWRPQTINTDFKWATSSHNDPIWKVNKVDFGEAEPTLWSITGVPSVQKCQSISAPQPSLCLVDGQYETELKKVTSDSQSRTYYRPIINQQPQNHTRVVAEGNNLSIHDQVTGKVLIFSKSLRLSDTYMLSQSYMLPFKKNIITYHWVAAHPSTHGQLHGYQLSHILYGVNYEHTDASSLSNQEVDYNHKIEFQWFKNRATGYPRNIIIHSKVLMDGRHHGTNFSEVFRYNITPDIYHGLTERPTNYPIVDLNSGFQCIITKKTQKHIDYCWSQAQWASRDHGSSALNFHIIGSIRKTAPDSITTNEQRANFVYQGCTANHLGGCLTGIISGPVDKQWSHKINFSDSNKQQKHLTQVSSKGLWWHWLNTGPKTQHITRTQSNNSGAPGTAAKTNIIRQTQWTVKKAEKLPSGSYSSMDITDEWGNSAIQKLIRKNHNGDPSLIRTQYISPELGAFPRERLERFTYNRQRQLASVNVTAHQKTNVTNRSIQQEAITHYKYKDINMPYSGVSDGRFAKFSMPARISVIENLGPQGAGQNFIPNTQRISETEWTYTNNNPNQYRLETFVCQRDKPLAGTAMITILKHRHCGNNARVSSTNITGLNTDWIDGDDNNNKITLQIEDTINKQISQHQYTALGLLREHKAVDGSNDNNALSDIVTTYEVHDWQLSKVSANNSPYVHMYNRYTLDGTASWKKTFHGDNVIFDSKEVSHTTHQIDPLTLSINQQKALASNGDVLSDISTHYVRPSHQGTNANFGVTLTDNLNRNTTQQVYNADGQVTSISNKDNNGGVNFVNTRQYYGSGALQGLLQSTSSQIGSGAATANALVYDTKSHTITTTQGDKSLTNRLNFIAYGSELTSTNSDGYTITTQTTPLRTEARDKDNNTLVVSTAYWKTCTNVPDKAFRVITRTLIKAAGSESKTLRKDCYDTRGNLLYQETDNRNVTLYQYYPNNRIKHQEDCERNGTALSCSNKKTYHYYTQNTTGLIGQLNQITYTSQPDDGSRTDMIDRKIRYQYQVSEGGQKGLLINQTTFNGNSETEYLKEEYSDFDDTHGPRQVKYTFAITDNTNGLVNQEFTVNNEYYKDGDYKHQLKSITYPSMLDNPAIRPSTTLTYLNKGTTDAPRHGLDTSKLSVKGKNINVYDYDGMFPISRSKDLYRHRLATGRLTDSASRDINTRLVNDAKNGASMWFQHIVPKGDALSSNNYTLLQNSDHGKLVYEVVDGEIRKHKQWDNTSKIAEFRYEYADKQQLRTVTQTQYQDSQHQGGGSQIAHTDTQTYHYSQGDITSIDTHQLSNTPTHSTTNYSYDRSGRLSSYKNRKDRTLKRLNSVDYYHSGQVSAMNYVMPSNNNPQQIKMTYYGDKRVKNVNVRGKIEGDTVNVNTRYIYNAADKVAVTIESIHLNTQCHSTGDPKEQQKISLEIPGLYKWVRYTDNCHTNKDRTFAYHYLPSGSQHAKPVLREAQINQRNLLGQHYYNDLLTYQYDHYGSVVAQSGPDVNTPYADSSDTNTLLLRQYFTPHGKRVISGDSLPLEQPTTWVQSDKVQLARQVRLNYNGIDVTGGLSDHRQISGTELLNMGDYRLYSPDIGRFINPDDRDFPEKGPEGYNRYIYAANDPVHRVDLDGHMDAPLPGQVPEQIPAPRGDPVTLLHFQEPEGIFRINDQRAGIIERPPWRRPRVRAPRMAHDINEMTDGLLKATHWAAILGGAGIAINTGLVLRTHFDNVTLPGLNVDVILPGLNVNETKTFYTLWAGQFSRMLNSNVYTLLKAQGLSPAKGLGAFTDYCGGYLGSNMVPEYVKNLMIDPDGNNNAKLLPSLITNLWWLFWDVKVFDVVSGAIRAISPECTILQQRNKLNAICQWLELIPITVGPVIVLPISSAFIGCDPIVGAYAVGLNALFGTIRVGISQATYGALHYRQFARLRPTDDWPELQTYTFSRPAAFVPTFLIFSAYGLISVIYM